MGSEEELSDDLEADEDMPFDSDDDQEEKPKIKGGKKKSFASESVFASAEEFASMLEDEGGSKIAPGGSNAVSNKDNARKCFYIDF